MDATLYADIERLEQRGWASPDDFALGLGTPVSARLAVEDPHWSLYALDKAADCAWFVDLPDAPDLSHSAFFSEDQHKSARRALKMPLAALEDLAAVVPPPEHVIFIFNIARCGSTLVSNILNAVPGVWGLSEPDAYTNLIMQNYDVTARQDFPRARAVRLIRACTRLLFRPPGGSRPPVFAVKFKSQSLFQADLYHEAMPEASYVFLYRSALSWANSYYQMMRKYGLPAVLTGVERALAWNITTAADSPENLRPYVDLDADTVPLELALAPAWVRCMEEYRRLLRAGVPFFALRYEEINADRLHSATRLLRHCGLPPEFAPAALAAFDRDSQAGTQLARDIKVDGLSAPQLSRLRDILALHPTHSDPDARLPDIYSAPASGAR